MSRGNPVVFFDVALAGVPVGRIKMELFADVCPRTAENFRQFCTGKAVNADSTCVRIYAHRLLLV